MKILYVVKNMRISNGVSSYVMNYYRELIKKENVKIDFLIVSDVGSPYYEEIKNNGSNIYIMPSFKHFFKMIKFLKNIFKNNNYDILHSNVFNSNFPIAYMAKKYNVPVRILHSHATSNGDNWFKIIRNKPFQFLSIYYSNYLFACSNLAGKNIYKKKEYYVVNNAIDLKKFEFDKEIRNNIRKKENIDDSRFILSTVGRITEQKNPVFILNIIKKISDFNSDFVFWWFGNGNLDNEIKNKAVEMGIDNNIKFFGAVNDVYNYYNAMDLFILPSLYEGLPVVGIEAQANGVPVIFADTITKEVKMNETVEFISILSIEEWVTSIKKKLNEDFSHNCNSKKLNENYDIKKLSNKLLLKYEELIKKDMI